MLNWLAHEIKTAARRRTESAQLLVRKLER